MPEKKKSFILYCEYKNNIAVLSDEEKGRLFSAILEYADTGNITELSGATAMAFSFIKNQLDINAEKYQATCEKRRLSSLKAVEANRTKRSSVKP